VCHCALDASDLLVGRDGRSTGPRGFSADVYDLGALARELLQA
jgi:hypothetical protein